MSHRSVKRFDEIQRATVTFELTPCAEFAEGSITYSLLAADRLLSPERDLALAAVYRIATHRPLDPENFKLDPPHLLAFSKLGPVILTTYAEDGSLLIGHTFNYQGSNMQKIQ